MNVLIQRMIRAAKLDVSLYEEVEADTSAKGQAMTVVILSSVAAGIGSTGIGGFKGMITLTLMALAAWYLWAYITYFVGVKLLPEPQTQSNPQELLRTIGFSSSPGILRILGVLPGLGGLVLIITGAWMLAAMVVAVRQALDYRSTGRAVAVCIIGWVLQSLMLTVAFALFGRPDVTSSSH
ncbi:MAG: YIP1 family protein [Desulfosoma sp.]